MSGEGQGPLRFLRAQHGPCDACEFRRKCASEKLACSRYFAYADGSESWQRIPAVSPDHVTYARANDGLIVHDAYRGIAALRRERKQSGALPTVDDVATHLRVDRGTALELIERFKAKQGIVWCVAEDELPA